MNKFRFLKKGDEIVVTDDMVTQAAMKGISLSEHLNKEYAEVVEHYNGELDAFDIALLSAGIIVKSDPKMGLQSSTMDKFFTTNENKNLFPEFMIRQLRQISNRDDSLVSKLVASTRIIQGDAARQVVLDLSDTPAGKANQKALKYRRIGEGADIPVATLKLGEMAIKIYKYGIGVRATYEVLRRTTIDMFRKQMELVSKQAEMDEVGTVIETIINGDGNTNPATVYTASTLNSAAVEGKIDATTLLKFLTADKDSGLVFDTVITDDEAYVDFLTTLMDKNLTNAINPRVQFEFPQTFINNLTVIYSKDLPLTSANKHQIIGLAKDYAIERTIEAGSIINEVEKASSNQTQTAYMTENAGFNKIDSRASAILVLA